MPTISGRSLSVSALFAEREAKRQREKEGEGQLQRKQREDLAEFKQRLDNFTLTDEKIESVLSRIRNAFEHGQSEVLLTSFPSSFCTDGGRAIRTADMPPINKPKEEDDAAKQDREPEWLATLPQGARVVYEYWKTNLKPGGFRFSARTISYPGGMPGDVGLFFSWPKSAAELKP